VRHRRPVKRGLRHRRASRPPESLSCRQGWGARLRHSAEEFPEEVSPSSLRSRFNSFRKCHRAAAAFGFEGGFRLVPISRSSSRILFRRFFCPVFRLRAIGEHYPSGRILQSDTSRFVEGVQFRITKAQMSNDREFPGACVRPDLQDSSPERELKQGRLGFIHPEARGVGASGGGTQELRSASSRLCGEARPPRPRRLPYCGSTASNSGGRKEPGARQPS
jgi:hypothetical protein